MPLTEIQKIKEAPVEIICFYIACIAGIASGIYATARGDLPLPSWAITVALLMYVYMSINLLWWFGDHPEEDGEE